MLTDRYDSFQGGQGGQGMQGGEVVLVSAPIQDENLRRLEQKIDLIMETQQQQMRGKPTMDQSKKNWKKSTSLYQRGDRQIAIGPQGMKFHGHIAPVSTGSRPSKSMGKVTNRLRTAGGADENTNSGTILNKAGTRAVNTAIDYNSIQSLNEVYRNVLHQKKEKN